MADRPFNPAHVLPDAPGIYEMNTGNYRVYDGKSWYFGGSTVAAARAARPDPMPEGCQLPWRIPNANCN